MLSPPHRIALSLATGALLPCLSILEGANQSPAEDALIGVAANFAHVAEVLAESFHGNSSCTVTVSSGSSGTLYAQIRNGAPFDAFLSADTIRAARLEREGFALADSRFTYARGKLALWVPSAHVGDDLVAVLREGSFRHLAMAMPSTAPYGAAAQQVLEHFGLLEVMSPKIVRGENVTQAHQFVASGNAELGFVAYSQVIDRPASQVWVIDEDLYEPVLQQAVLLDAGVNNACAHAFLDYLRTDPATILIRQFGYGTEESR
jgi:molybdate transport system substrate-binding protein